MPGSYQTQREIQQARAQAEIETGRRATRRAMAEGIVQQCVEELCKAHGVVLDWDLVTTDRDIRQWAVKITMPQYSAMFFEESFFDFPTATLKAQLMLVAGK